MTFSAGPRRSLRRTIVAGLSRASALIIGRLTSKYTDTQPSTGDAIRKYCEANKIALRSVKVPILGRNSKDMGTAPPPPPPAILHMLSTTTPGHRVVLYFHGGGYTQPAFEPSHIPFALKLAAAANASTLGVLEYGLAPKLRYPGQLVQGIESLRYLLSSSTAGGAGMAASSIVVIGDSAGANLVAGVLAHMHCTSPYADPLNLTDRIGAAVLISPWVSNGFNSDSYVANAKKDTIDVKGMIAAREKWSPKTEEVWADMLEGKIPGSEDQASFWTNVFSGHARAVEKAVVTVGEDEIFLDDISAFAKMAGAKLKSSDLGEDATATLVRCPGETHCGAMLDALIGLQKEHSMLSEVMMWLEGL
ncbi:hypothetical protein GT037_010065 [Alternaria burnsii]|uniref:Alpha/beta hydrolase fold-3 domain-containing protein n=1 Tax=Alternaria burnsii TaxID=1187904 RepID=A0A8H7EAZ8_9PLEO|nr:uncharacterized protein GT037_010065 [Alternaria burnsii]KAF7671842.1 hypothetical protein GT037_010065 [Alternaria burnsii]CAI9630965.1 unnamed protein product [Alternaria burnsii]